MKTNFFTFITQLFLVLCCAIFTTKSLAQSRPEMVVILDNTVNHIQRNTLKVQFNATQIDSTFPSQTLLWRINSFPFNMTINGITYQINNIGDAVERGKNQPGMSSSSSNYDIAIPNFGQPQPCPFGIDGQDDNTLLPFCNSLINTIPDITCAVKVAILDTGVDPIFSLIPFIGGNYSFISPGIVFPVPCTFNNYHGTKVASVMAHYLKKISGSSIISIKVLDDCGQGTVFDAIRGIDKANSLNVDIINMSFIGQDEVTANQKTPLEVAIDLAKDNNILAVEAAGNEDLNIDYRPIYQKTITTVGGTSTTNYKVAYPPASLENTNSIVVGSYSCDMKKSNFSNYGKVSVDIYVPGEFVLTRDGLNVKKYSSGTSFAAPIVAGIAALLKCANPNVDSLKKATLNYAKTVAKAVYIAPDTTKNFTFLSGSQPVMRNEIIDVSINNVTCHNACNGVIRIKVKGDIKPYNYKWGNNSINGNNLFSISGLCAGVHCVTITDELNCPIETCVTITEPAPLTINAGADITLCAGSSAVLSANGNGVFQWNTGQNIPDITVSPTITTTYSVTLTNINGCSATDDLLVSVITCSNHVVVTLKVWTCNFNTNTMLIDADLHGLATFPTIDPYRTHPLNAKYIHVNNPQIASITSPTLLLQTGGQAVVDWVFIELRTGISGNTIVAYTQSALLLANGKVVATDGISPVSFLNAPSGNYYIALRHRNHLGFRTSSKIPLGNIPTLQDFTNNAIPLYGITPLTPNGYMIGGDANSDGSVDAADSAIWEAQNGLFDDYTNNTDYNMDGSVDSLDSAIWETNNGAYQELE